jgi:hypothetical protein
MQWCRETASALRIAVQLLRKRNHCFIISDCSVREMSLRCKPGQSRAFFCSVLRTILTSPIVERLVWRPSSTVVRTPA